MTWDPARRTAPTCLYKVCLTCRICKPIQDFSKCKARYDGLCYRCRKCNSIYRKKKKKIITREITCTVDLS